MLVSPAVVTKNKMEFQLVRRVVDVVRGIRVRLSIVMSRLE